jgi:hypothetical protein
LGDDRHPEWWLNFQARREPTSAPRRPKSNDEVHMALQGHINHLSNQKKKIEDIINHEMNSPDWDELRVAALKKQKLRIKDELERLRAAPN